NLALSSSSSGSGGGGAQRASQNMNLFKAMEEANRLANQKVDIGAAERMAKTSGETLNGLLGGLNASFQDLSVTLGDSGVMDAVKSIVKALTILTDGLNAMLGPIASIRKFLTFGADVNRNPLQDFAKGFVDLITTILLAGTAI